VTIRWPPVPCSLKKGRGYKKNVSTEERVSARAGLKVSPPAPKYVDIPLDPSKNRPEDRPRYEEVKETEAEGMPFGTLEINQGKG